MNIEREIEILKIKRALLAKAKQSEVNSVLRIARIMEIMKVRVYRDRHGDDWYRVWSRNIRHVRKSSRKIKEDGFSG